MNPVLAYAIEHQAKARAILVGYYGVAPDDVEDVAQDMLLNILRTAPEDVANVKGYWSAALWSVAANYYRLNARLPLPVQYEHADPRQDPEATVIRRETLRDIWADASPAEQRAIVQVTTQPISHLPGKTRVPLCNLRRRLRERAAA